MNEIVATVFATLPSAPDVTTTLHEAVAPDGAVIPLRLHRREGSAPGSLASTCTETA